MTQETWEEGEDVLRLVIIGDGGFLVRVSWVAVGDEGVELTFSMVAIEVVLSIVLRSK